MSKGYEVHLEVFEGPLDLLLHLIKKNDLEIENIPISEITHEYLGYLDLMKELNLDIAGDFLVMATTLMQIKAHSLLPATALADEESGPDPRSELVAKLQEYQRFKEAASFLQKRADDFSGIYYRGAPRFGEKEKALNIRIFDLLTTLREVLDRAEDEGRVVAGEEFPLEDKIRKILALLEARPYLSLREILMTERKRRAIITCFLALLELIKTQRAFARQESPFAEIMIYKKEAPPEQVSPVWPAEEPAADPLAEPPAPPEPRAEESGGAPAPEPAGPAANGERPPQEDAADG